MMKILVVDDDPVALKLARVHLLQRGFDVVTATDGGEALELARASRPDAILSDVMMPGLDGFGLCRSIRGEAALHDVPVVLVSAYYTAETDRRLALDSGAQDLVARDGRIEHVIDVLVSSISLSTPPVRDELITARAQIAALHRQVWHERACAQKLESRASDYDVLMKAASDAVVVIAQDGTIIDANQRALDVFHLERDQVVGHHQHEFAAPEQEQRMNDAMRPSSEPVRLALRGPDGSVRHMEVANVPIERDGKPCMLMMSRDVTKKVEALDKLAASEQRYRGLVESIPDIVWSGTIAGHTTFVSANVERISGFTPEELEIAPINVWMTRIHVDDIDKVRRAIEAFAEDGEPFHVEYRFQHKNRSWIWLAARGMEGPRSNDAQTVNLLFSDLTDRKRIEQQRDQMVKLEAIGRLSGGIAHDFNNILSVILANCEFLLEALSGDDPRRSDALEIRAAGERGAGLTRQLLAFSRKQVTEPKIVDVDATIRDSEKMLRRLIGEDIALTFRTSGGGARVRADASQLEQVIMNLAINARDAMPDGGKLVIETREIEVDAGFAELHERVRPGRYVLLAVTDTGCGMSPDVQQHIFEPFFTTKGPGKGTGLGLSTVYGIVQQGRGAISVYSELGHGTTFKIYLPAQADKTTALETRPDPATTTDRGTETILVVEDEPGVRSGVRRILEARGYYVLVASGRDEAVRVASTHDGRIDLVLTDLVMPGPNGLAVVDELRGQTLDLKAMYMSGYTDHAVFSTGEVPAGVSFIQKPFSARELARRVRDLLDQRDEPREGAA